MPHDDVRSEPSVIPPYISFNTLLNLLEQMRTSGLPPRIDREYLSGMSATHQTQVIAALRSLGLIGDEHEVTETLVVLAESPDRRPEMIARVLQTRFPEMVALGRTNATAHELNEAFGKYGLSGDTLRKAVGFYLRAAEYAGVPLSADFRLPRQAAVGTDQTHRRQRGPREPTARRGAAGGGAGRGHGGPFEIRLPDLHPALAGVLGDLPPRGTGWTERQRDDFMTAFRAVVNYVVPTIEEGEREADAEEEEGF